MTTDFFSNGSPCTMYMMLASFTEVGQMLCVGISSCASGITQFLKEACEQLMIWHLDKNCGKWLVLPYPIPCNTCWGMKQAKMGTITANIFQSYQTSLILIRKIKEIWKNWTPL